MFTLNQIFLVAHSRWGGESSVSCGKSRDTEAHFKQLCTQFAGYKSV